MLFSVFEVRIRCGLSRFDGVSISFTDAGHLLGSSSITINVTENGETEKIVFPAT